MATWLVKSEPNVYAWETLVKEGRTHWNGVRNHQAAIYLKTMKKGDLAFFYHSNEGKEIVGVCKIAKEAYPDPTDEAGRFVMVDVAPVKALARPVTLAAIKANAKLKDIGLIRQSRLSVMPISDSEWKEILAMGATKL